MTRSEIIQGLNESGRASLADAVAAEFSVLDTRIAELEAKVAPPVVEIVEPAAPVETPTPKTEE